MRPVLSLDSTHCILKSMDGIIISHFFCMKKYLSLLAGASLLIGSLPALAQDTPGSSSDSSVSSSVSSTSDSSSVSSTMSSPTDPAAGNAWGRRCKDEGKTGLKLAECVKAMKASINNNARGASKKKMVVRKVIKKTHQTSEDGSKRFTTRRSVKARQALTKGVSKVLKKVLIQKQGESASSSSAMAQ